MMHWLVKLIVSFNLVVFIENRTCSGVTGTMCCDGFAMNNITGKCEKCPIGYHLKDCLEKCNSPTYGEACQFICSCPDYDCHFEAGCLHDVETVTHNRPKISTSKVLTRSTVSLLTVGVSNSSRLNQLETQDFHSDNKMFIRTTVTYTSRDNNINIFKENIVVYVITSLIGVFVFFFALCVLTNIYFKCCRNQNTVGRMEGNDWKAQYKTLRFPAADPEAIFHLESQEQMNTDFTYLTPVLSGNENCESSLSFENQTETIITKNQSYGKQAIETTFLGQNIVNPTNDMPQHVYIEVSEESRDVSNTDY